MKNSSQKQVQVIIASGKFEPRTIHKCNFKIVSGKDVVEVANWPCSYRTVRDACNRLIRRRKVRGSNIKCFVEVGKAIGEQNW